MSAVLLSMVWQYNWPWKTVAHHNAYTLQISIKYKIIKSVFKFSLRYIFDIKIVSTYTLELSDISMITQ